MTMDWKGRLVLYHEEGVGTLPVHMNYLVTNIQCISDVLPFLMSL
jgi:hypothetical protein